MFLAKWGVESGEWRVKGEKPRETGDRGQRSEGRGYWHTVTTSGGQGGPVGPAIGGGFWDEVEGIILERLRLGAPKEMGRGECLQVGLTEVFTLWG
jgi:hypothetical protein